VNSRFAGVSLISYKLKALSAKLREEEWNAWMSRSDGQTVLFFLIIGDLLYK
jgi:hypothetical protein